MKITIIKLKVLMIMLFFLGCETYVFGQNTSGKSDMSERLYEREFLISPRVGYDIPFFNNNTPYIEYKGGIEYGLSVDYYWKRFGLGADFDYVGNKTKSIYPTANLFSFSPAFIPVQKFTLTQRKIERMFYGIGPDYRWKTKSGKLSAELNTRVGLGHVKGGQVSHIGIAPPFTYLLNYHHGYKDNFSLATKAQLRFNYLLSDHIGINAGAYYIRHYGVEELEVVPGISAWHQPLKDFAPGQHLDGAPVVRGNNKADVSSFGMFAGLTFILKSQKKDEPKKGKYALTVTARDKFTKQVLPEADVVLKNSYGDVVATATTNSFGVVVFEDIKPDDYIIEGMLYQVPLQSSNTVENEFVSTHPLQKELLYTNMEFIVKGTAVECTSNKGIERVMVMLYDKSNGVETSVSTARNGQYGFQVTGNKEYKIYGKKDMYMSQIENISTKGLNRSTTLFVKLEICMDEVHCDEALALRNLHYDVNQYNLRDDAKLELDKVVQFMIDNPGVRLELASHTDSRSDSKYNQDLSQKRAEGAANYVVAHGISRSRITGIGYGETRILNGCTDGVKCSEAKHQVNRRTEMNVKCK